MLVVKGNLMTSGENGYGYKPRIEELILNADKAKGQSIFKEHKKYEKPLGKITETEIVYDEKIAQLVVQGTIEVYDESAKEYVLKLVESGGFSSTYADNGFLVKESNCKYFQPIEVCFDAYRTDEIKLFLEMRELSKELESAIYCRRIRRHAIGGVLAFIGLTIGAHIIGKIFDDIGLYDKFKKKFIKMSRGSDIGKEAMIEVISPKENKDITRRLVINIEGNDVEIEEIMDHLRENEYIKIELEKFNNEYDQYKKVVIKANKSGDIQITKISVEKIDNSIEYYG